MNWNGARGAEQSGCAENVKQASVEKKKVSLALEYNECITAKHSVIHFQKSILYKCMHCMKVYGPSAPCPCHTVIHYCKWMKKTSYTVALRECAVGTVPVASPPQQQSSRAAQQDASDKSIKDRAPPRTSPSSNTPAPSCRQTEGTPFRPSISILVAAPHACHATANFTAAIVLSFKMYVPVLISPTPTPHTLPSASYYICFNFLSIISYLQKNRSFFAITHK